MAQALLEIGSVVEGYRVLAMLGSGGLAAGRRWRRRWRSRRMVAGPAT
jgi:hypothetical protein